jgi:channel protein (hemolysin III family)
MRRRAGQEIRKIDPTPWLGIQDPVASLSHLLGGAVFAVLGIALVQRGRGNRLRVVGLIIYVAGVVVTLLASGLLHMTARHTELRSFMVLADHAAIFFLIAATYTPIHIIEFTGWMRWGVLGVIWSAAFAGIVLKIGFMDVIPEWVSLTLYLLLGWMGLFTAYALHRVVGLKPLLPIVFGALAYTIGAFIDFSDLADPIPGVMRTHEVFHLFVLVGVAAHWAYIRRITIYAPIADLYRT